MAFFGGKKENIKTTSIATRIDEIIQMRHEQLPIVQEKLDELARLEESIAKFERMKAVAIDDLGNVRANTEYTGLLTKYPLFAQELGEISFSNVMAYIGDARSKLEAYRNRLNRDDVTIAICGRARGGKSTFLNRISGLTHGEIPESDGSDCTGKPSIIHNRDCGFVANIAFVSEKQICDVCNRYIKVAVGEDVAYKFYVRTKSEIKNLDTKEITNLARSKKLAECSDASSELMKIVESYDEWADFVGRKSIELSNRSEICKYVAQEYKDEETSKHNYHRFYAVDRCEISTKFVGNDLGKLTLLDTVGLGDKKEGIQEAMLSIIKEKCDAFIYCICPTAAGNGIDAETSKIITKIQKSNADNHLNAWMGVLLNKVTNPPPSGNPAKNVDFIDGADKTVRDEYDLYTGIASCIETEDCVKYLNDFLSYFIEHLDEVDKTYLTPAYTAVQNLKDAYLSVVKKLDAAISKTVVQSPGVQSLIVDKAIDAIKETRTRIRSCATGWEEKANDGCPILNSKTETILNQLKYFSPEYPSEYIPSIEKIDKEFAATGNAVKTFDDELGKIRVKIAHDFYSCEDDLSAYITEAKKEVARVLYEDCEFSKLCSLPQGESEITVEWLKALSENVLENYPTIKHAIDQLYDFSFSLRGFLTFEVRLCLDKINPSSSQKIPTPPILTGGRASARTIYAQLGWALVDLANNGLELRIKELECKPNRAIYAVIGDFFENLFNSETSEKEWLEFYVNEGIVLWPDEIKAVAKDAIAFESWSCIKDELHSHLNSGLISSVTV